jgi:glyoxylate reductase
MKYKVLVTKPIPKEGLVYLGKDCQIIMPPKEGPFYAREKILDLAQDIDAVIVAGDKIDEEFLEKAKQLKVISAYSVGYDNVDISAATKRGIPVTNLPEAVTESTAELAFALMLALSRRLIEADHYVRKENDQKWHQFLLISHELFEKKLGIIGFGRIGQAVARRASAFGMQVYYYDVVKKDTFPQYLPFKELISSVDYLSLHVPHNKNTHHLLGKKEFQIMKKSAFLINASRGAVISESDLIQALKEKEIAGAGLDVYENEPHVTPELTYFPNVVLTPHLGTGTIETRIKMALKASDNVIKILKGEIPKHVVNKNDLNL